MWDPGEEGSAFLIRWQLRDNTDVTKEPLPWGTERTPFTGEAECRAGRARRLVAAPAETTLAASGKAPIKPLALSWGLLRVETLMLT